MPLSPPGGGAGGSPYGLEPPLQAGLLPVACCLVCAGNGGRQSAVPTGGRQPFGPYTLYRKVMIWARVQVLSTPKVVGLTPLVTSFS